MYSMRLRTLICALLIQVSADAWAQTNASIAFTYVPPWGSFANLEGQVTGVVPGDHKVAVYIYVEGWWTKPYSVSPLTPLGSDGSWTCDVTTGGADQDATRISAFLITNGYSPPLLTGQSALPQALYDNALASAYAERSPNQRTLEFSGLTWTVKSSASPLGPGPNYFSDQPEDVWVDANGELHLRIAHRDGRWYCTEVIATNSFGFGTYIFHVRSGLTNLDRNVVLGLFTWDGTAPEYNYRELDVELSRWGVEGNALGQYVVQPWNVGGNMFRFDIGQDTNATHCLTWRPNSVAFASAYGVDRVSAPEDVITNWTYAGSGVPPAGGESPRINFWLMGGTPPSNGQEAEVVIKGFQFVPLFNWRITAVGVRDMDFYAPSNGAGYAVVVTNAGAGVERRCDCDGHHFLSVLNDGGILALRPHPGVDLNGWGSTLYLQPFLPGAVLRGSTITNCTAYSDRIEVGATGLVSRGTSDQYGTWELALTCAYDRLTKRLTAAALYTIRLAGLLGDDTGDLNLAKLASSYLDDVPLVDGTTNDTGDMTYAYVQAGNLDTNWNPSLQPGYFPSDQTSDLLVDVIGAFNCADTRAQGHHAIQAAYKPSVKLVLASRQADIPMIFGGFFDTNKAKDFTADNVGITPLVLKSSTATQFEFGVTIESTALPGDGVGVLADLAATDTSSIATAEVYYTENLGPPFRRYVGNLDATGTNGYTGTVAVPFPATLPHPAAGFFRLEVVTNGGSAAGS